MKVTFLEADVPLTKQFTATSKTSYPNVMNFTSHVEEINSIEELFAAIVTHADKGHCMIKGNLTRPLVNESRAKTTTPLEPTRLLVLDLDGAKKGTSVPLLLESLGMKGVDHIVQYSASYGVVGQPDELKCHVFIMLDNAYNPAMIKHWKTHSNLTIEVLRDSLKLTKSSMALSYVLDPTVAQNDKLIYLAKPICTPASLDTVSQRITLHKGTSRYASLNFNNTLPPEALRQSIELKINELRKAQGLEPKKRWVYKTHAASGVQYLAKPDVSIVTDVKYERGFAILNLNGGDSWGYYHPEDNPEFLNNFKDEPIYKISELCPAYYQQAKKHAEALKHTAAPSVQVGQLKPIYLVFRDMKSAMYYNGIYYPSEQKWNLASAKSEKMLQDFMVQYGQPEPDVIPIWDLVFDPKLPPIDVAQRKVNLYTESEILKRAKAATYKAPASGADPALLFPTIKKVIWSVIGSDQMTYDHFINWVGYIVQYLERAQTGWVMQGVHGTGKGTLVHHILRPLLGISNTTYLEQHQLEDRFNEHFENSLLTCVDEVEISSLDGNNKIMAMLKTLITEPFINIRKMRSAAYQSPNYNNVMVFSNFKGCVTVEPTDRRYNVAVYQERKLELTEDEIFKLIPAELDAFATYLVNMTVDVSAAKRVVENEARAQIKDLSLSSIDEISQSVLKGSLETLWSYIVELSHAQGRTISTAPIYKDLMYNIVLHDYRTLSREELMIVFMHAIGETVPSSPAKFSRYLNHHGIKIATVSRGSQVFRGVKVDWQYEPEWYEEIKARVLAERAPKLKVVREA